MRRSLVCFLFALGLATSLPALGARPRAKPAPARAAARAPSAGPQSVARNAGARFTEISRTASMVVPLGLNPLLALGGLGLAASLGFWQAPPSIALIAHPAAWLCFFALGLLIQFGRSTKYTKPLAEALGTGESVLALFAVALAAAPLFSAPAPQVTQADLLTGLLVVTATTVTVGTVIVLRTALDILTWLSPVPLIDAMFQIVKVVLTAALVLLAVVAPVAALVVNVILVIAAFFALRWAIRTARFGCVVVWDVISSRFGDRTPLPRDPVVADDLGPFVAFAEALPGVKRRERVSLSFDAGRWVVTTSGRRPRTIFLGDGSTATLKRGLLGVRIKTADGEVLIPARYGHLTEELAQATRAAMALRQPKLTVAASAL